MSASEDRFRDLLVRGLAGDAPAYHAFLKDLSAHLRAFLRARLARLPDEVEDLVQETLLAIHNQRHTYDAGQPLTAWVHAIARYKLIDLLRRRAGREALNDPLDEWARWFMRCIAPKWRRRFSVSGTSSACSYRQAPAQHLARASCAGSGRSPRYRAVQF